STLRLKCDVYPLRRFRLTICSPQAGLTTLHSSLHWQVECPSAEESRRHTPSYLLVRRGRVRRACAAPDALRPRRGVFVTHLSVNEKRPPSGRTERRKSVMRYEFERNGDRLGSVLWEGPGQVDVDVPDADLRSRFE